MKNLSTADIVKEELEKDIFLQNSLSKNLINHSALARELLPTIKLQNKKATIESVTVAIARYSSQLRSNKPEKDLTKQIASSQVSLKNDIEHITFLRNNLIFNSLTGIAKEIRWDLDEILFINQGSGEITIVFDKKNEPLFRKIMSNIVEKRDNCAILSISESNIKDLTPSIDVPGLYAYFINQISKNNLNILDIVSTKTQITFVLEEKDIMKAYEVINDCIKHYRNKI